MSSEAKIQAAAHRYVQAKYPKVLSFSIPNEQLFSGQNAAIRGKRLNDMGRRVGAADYFIAEPNGMHCGLFLEFKTAKGRQSVAQRAFELDVKGRGYAYDVVHSLDEAMLKIDEYLNQKPTLCH